MAMMMEKPVNGSRDKDGERESIIVSSIMDKGMISSRTWLFDRLHTIRSSDSACWRPTLTDLTATKTALGANEDNCPCPLFKHHEKTRPYGNPRGQELGASL